MDKINKIHFNGIDYLLYTDERDTVRELDGLGDGSKDFIFIGLMDKTDADKPITYSYLSGLLEKDSVNNKVFEPTTLPITIRHYFKSVIGKAFFVIVPKEDPNLYSLSSRCQCFTDWGEGVAVDIDFGTITKPYKLFRFGNFNNMCTQPITYTF